METRELRIENIVNVYNVGECRISGLDKIDNTILPIVENGVKEFKVTLKQLKPIPLTEEWLLRFGFEKDANKYSLSDFRFHIEEPCNFNGLLFCDGFRVITEKIQYVHQLQNLYYALTTQELNQLKK